LSRITDAGKRIRDREALDAMTKAELIEALSNKVPLNKADAERAIAWGLVDAVE